jgi:hypothetical protein
MLSYTNSNAIPQSVPLGAAKNKSTIAGGLTKRC